MRDNGVGFDMKYVHKLFGVCFNDSIARTSSKVQASDQANVRQDRGARRRALTWAEGELDRGANFFIFRFPN